MVPRVQIISSRLRLILLNYLHTTYKTPERLWRVAYYRRQHVGASSKPGPTFNIVWGFPLIAGYWGRIIEVLSRAVGKPTDTFPLRIILEVLERGSE